MSGRGGRSAWLTALVVAALLPLGVFAIADTGGRAGSGLATAVGIGLGVVAAALLPLQFLLVSRFGVLSRALGSDALMQLHRGVGVLALVVVLAHPLLLPGVTWRDWNPLAGLPGMRAGAIALWAVVAIVGTSYARARLRLRYELWHVLHVVLGLAILVGTTAHVAAFSASAAAWGFVAAYCATAGLVSLEFRVLRPWRVSLKPWRVVANDDVVGSTRLLRVAPEGHRGLTFEAGQFAWVATGRSPFWSQQHPLSIASSPGSGPDVDFAIKALGDWSGREVPRLAVGARVWIDGPFGAFSLEACPDAERLVLIAGGIGIAPMRAMLLAMRDRGDTRPVMLIYAASDPARVVFADELAALAPALRLDIVYVFEHPPPDWTGDRGFVGVEILRRYVAEPIAAPHYFLCGPPAMMTGVEGTLRSLGVPESHLHGERFRMV